MKNLQYLLFIICLLVSYKAYSQTTTGNRTVSMTLPIVTLLDVEPVGNISINFVAPTEAGQPLINPTINNTKWINYTSAIALSGVTRRVTASINQIIPGVDIKLQANAASGIGAGNRGTPTGQVTLTTNAITIINGIGGAYTGTGSNNGHRLLISLTPNNYGNLSAQTNTPIVITYTITE